MRPSKRVLYPERLRRVPRQFSWVDQRLVRDGYLDRCDPRAAALYLFLVTVADAQGLSYFSEPTLLQRLHLEAADLHAARERLVELQLLAYQTPIYQVLALPEPRSEVAPSATVACDRDTARAHLARLLAQLERRRDRL
jgi:hypothetical protein